MVRNPPKGVVFTGNDRYEGFTIDLLNRISQDLSFKYEIVLSPGNEYGAPKSKRGEVQEWGGIVGEILAKVSKVQFFSHISSWQIQGRRCYLKKARCFMTQCHDFMQFGR